METKTIDLRPLQQYRRVNNITNGWGLADLLMHTFPGVACVAYADDRGRCGVWMKELRTFIGSRHAAPARAEFIVPDNAEEIEVPASQPVVDHIAALLAKEAAAKAAEVARAESVLNGTYQTSDWMINSTMAALNGDGHMSQRRDKSVPEPIAIDYSAERFNHVEPNRSRRVLAIAPEAFPIKCVIKCVSNKYITWKAADGEIDRLMPFLRAAEEAHRLQEIENMRAWAESVVNKTTSH